MTDATETADLMARIGTAFHRKLDELSNEFGEHPEFLVALLAVLVKEAGGGAGRIGLDEATVLKVFRESYAETSRDGLN